GFMQPSGRQDSGSAARRQVAAARGPFARPLACLFWLDLVRIELIPGGWPSAGDRTGGTVRPSGLRPAGEFGPSVLRAGPEQMMGSKSRMQGKAMPEPNATPVYAGVDVCKQWLDVHVHPSGLTLRVSNDRVGLKRLKRVLAALPVARVVMEATGKHHRAAQRSLHAAGLVVAVVNPLRARLFAEAAGSIAKTDAIDARLLAVMGAALEPAGTPPQPAALEAVSELVNARAAATAERTA